MCHIVNVLFIGYRGTGKSTVARLVAADLGWPCLDTDAVIERHAGCTIAEIFEERGESHFRDLEAQVLREALERPQVVVAAGGGAVMRPENRAIIRRQGTRVIWLRARPTTIVERLAMDVTTAERRPRLTHHAEPAQEVMELLSRRTPVYQECADVAIDTDDRSPGDIAAEALRQLATLGVRGPT